MPDAQAGPVKSIVIDPPYNTRSAFEHYDDKVIYGECTSLGEERLRREGVVFKQIPYDVKPR